LFIEAFLPVNRMHLENGIFLLPSGADKVPVTVQAAKQASPF
jgi:hypothetical protein